MAKEQVVPQDIQDEANKHCNSEYGGKSIIKWKYLTDSYIVGALNERAKHKTYIPLICKKDDVIYTWTTSKEGNHWINENGKKCDIDPDNCEILEVKLSNNQIITERAKDVWTDEDMINAIQKGDKLCPNFWLKEYKQSKNVL